MKIIFACLVFNSFFFYILHVTQSILITRISKEINRIKYNRAIKIIEISYRKKSFI